MFFNLFLVENSGSDLKDFSLFGEHAALFVIFSVCLTIVSVLLLTICGGCTDMEVGSENHPAASGGSMKHRTSGNYVSDTNTHVMQSSHVMQDNTNTSYGTQPLPYSLPPANMEVQGFTGYQSGTQAAQSSAPPMQPGGYGYAPGSNAHVQPMAAPPSYNESVRRNY